MKPRGPHPHHRLTALDVTRRGPGIYSDGGGLYLCVDESGARRWVVRVVVATWDEHGRPVVGKRREVGLSDEARAARAVEAATAKERRKRAEQSLKVARAEASKIRDDARAGRDPVEQRRLRNRMVPTFAECAREYHRTIVEPGLRNKQHAAIWIDSLELHAFPLVGEKPVNVIDTADVLRVLTRRRVPDDPKTAFLNEKAETARRVRQRIRKVLAWATSHKHRSGDNPAGEVLDGTLPKARVVVEHMPAMAYADVPGFLTRLRAAKLSPAVKLGIEFLVLTASRSGEVRGARWSEIDERTRIWSVPAMRVKSARLHRVPLARRAIAIVKEARTISDGGEYVFGGRWPDQPLSVMAFLMALRRLGHGDLTVHGFRSSFRNWCAERHPEVPRTVCEAALAHVLPSKVEAAYMRSDLLDQRRPLMSLWARFCTSKVRK